MLKYLTRIIHAGTLTKNVPLLLGVILFGFALSGCEKDLVDSTIAYENDFEAGDLSMIEGGVLGTFNGSTILGPYTNGGFTLELDKLPEHSALVIKLDLFIHDTWDGNATGDEAFPIGPDIWGFNLNDWALSSKKNQKRVFETTFSNATCSSSKCLRQSYPKSYPSVFEPKAGAVNRNLPGYCWLADEPDGTTRYRIEKTFLHSSDILSVKFYDVLVHNLANDARCDESWSVDNLEIELWRTE